jgi:hypothetical protein
MSFQLIEASFVQGGAFKIQRKKPWSVLWFLEG